MKPPPPIENARFTGHIRHYHRSGAKTQKSWDEWVEGRPPGTPSSRNWFKTTGILIAVLALIGIIVGLAIELG